MSSIFQPTIKYSSKWCMYEESEAEQQQRITARQLEASRIEQAAAAATAAAAGDEVELSDAEERLFRSISQGRLSDVQSFVRSHTQSILSFRTAVGETPLILACRLGKLNIAQYLVSKLASTKLCLSARDRSGVNALGYAAQGGHFELCDQLAGLGCELEPTYELNQFAQASGIRPTDVHRAIYTGFVRYCMTQDLQSALIPDVIHIVTQYLM